MKPTLHLTIALLFLILVSSCQKNEFKLKNDLQCTPGTSGSERNDWPTVQVEDGMLVFQSLDQYNQVRAWVQNAPIATLMEWQESLGFKSERYYYQEALGGICCPDEQANIDQIAATYEGKVLFDTTEK
jgi:hypothetical protein